MILVVTKVKDKWGIISRIGSQNNLSSFPQIGSETYLLILHHIHVFSVNALPPLVFPLRLDLVESKV